MHNNIPPSIVKPVVTPVQPPIVPISTTPIVPVVTTTPIVHTPPVIHTPSDPLMYNELEGVCSMIPTCISIDQQDMNNYNVSCDGVRDNTLYKNSEEEWFWDLAYNPATFARYPDGESAVRAACPSYVDPVSACSGISTCKSATKVPRSATASSGDTFQPFEWDVVCDGVVDNRLQMGAPDDWTWGAAYNDATSTHHKTATAAIKAACRPYPDPVQACENVASCLSATRTEPNSKSWDITCDGLLDNTLIMDAPDHWSWNKGYDTATFASYTTPEAAITAACPTYTTPSSVCKSIPGCISAVRTGPNDPTWDVSCNGVTPNTLHMTSPTSWSWRNGYSPATFATYTSAKDAITAACPTFTDPSTLCSKVPSCISAIRTAPNSQDWDIKCKGQNDNTLHMNTPMDWIWAKGYNAATRGRYTDPLTAMQEACPTFIDPIDGCTPANKCVSVKAVSIPNYLNTYAIKCNGDVDYTNTLTGYVDKWMFYKQYGYATFDRYPDAPSAINAYCNSQPRGGTYDR